MRERNVAGTGTGSSHRVPLEKSIPFRSDIIIYYNNIIHNSPNLTQSQRERNRERERGDERERRKKEEGRRRWGRVESYRGRLTGFLRRSKKASMSSTASGTRSLSLSSPLSLSLLHFLFASSEKKRLLTIFSNFRFTTRIMLIRRRNSKPT